MAGEHDMEAVFDLIAERGKRIMMDRDKGTHPAVFWRERVGKAWRRVYQHMTRPSDDLAAGLTSKYTRETADRFAALGYEAFMAAWYLGIAYEDGEDNPAVIAKRFTEMWERMAHLIR